MTGRTSAASKDRARLKAVWHDEWRHGARCGLLQIADGPRQRGGYPMGFHGWPLARRNAWFAGFNYGRNQRLRESGR